MTLPKFKPFILRTPSFFLFSFFFSTFFLRNVAQLIILSKISHKWCILGNILGQCGMHSSCRILFFSLRWACMERRFNPKDQVIEQFVDILVENNIIEIMLGISNFIKSSNNDILKPTSHILDDVFFYQWICKFTYNFQTNNTVEFFDVVWRCITYTDN